MNERVLCGAFGSGFVIDVVIRDDQRTTVDYCYQVKLRKLNIVAYFQESALRAFPYHKATHVIVGQKLISIDAYQTQVKKSRSDIIKSSITASQTVAAAAQHVVT